MQTATATIKIGSATVEHCASEERCLAADARSEGPKAPDSDLQLKAQILFLHKYAAHSLSGSEK